MDKKEARDYINELSFYKGALRAEMEILNKENEKTLSLEQENAKLKEVVGVMTEALDFYASTSSWDNRDELCESPCIEKNDMQLFEKWSETIGGKRAREAIQKVKELMNEKA